MILITYDIFDKTRDTAGLTDAIKSLGAWWHHLSTIWLVDTNLTPQEVYEKLAPHLVLNDHQLIIRVHKDYFGWLPEEAWEWLSSKDF